MHGSSEQPGAGWPRLGWESLPWDRSATQISRRQLRATSGPYLAAAPKPIAHRDVVLASDIHAAVAEAEAAIGRFDQYVTDTQAGSSSDAVELGPLSSILLRTESSSSSEIENLTVRARQLALAELAVEMGDDGVAARRRSGNAALVARNVAAVRAAIAASDRLDVDSILEMHRTLMLDSLPEQAGQVRTEQVWIGGTAAGPHLAQFVPPRHERVRPALDDLVAFMARDDLSPLVQAAVAHAQFETIHPFIDGNGRTGRAVVHSLLRAKQVTRRITVPVSAGLLTDTDAYFTALDHYRDGSPTPIVEQFCHATLTSIVNGHQLLDEIQAAKQSWSEQLTARRGAAAWSLADQLIGHPVLTVGSAARLLDVSDPAAERAIGQLADAGALTRLNEGRRNRVWQAPQVLDALDAFAVRAGRRVH